MIHRWTSFVKDKKILPNIWSSQPLRLDIKHLQKEKLEPQEEFHLLLNLEGNYERNAYSFPLD